MIEFLPRVQEARKCKIRTPCIFLQNLLMKWFDRYQTTFQLLYRHFKLAKFIASFVMEDQIQDLEG